MKKVFTLRHNKRRGGYTLIELTFSIALYSAISAIALAGFVGILGIYNKAQSLTRTQQEARNALETLTKDLRRTTKVQHYTLTTTNDDFPGGSGPNPAATDATAARAKDFWCLSDTTSSFQVGYALQYVAGEHYNLVRSPSCSGYADRTLVVSTDAWSDLGNNLDAGASVAYGESVSLPPINGGLCPATPGFSNVEARPLSIKKMVTPGDAAPVWQVRVSVHRGQKAPNMCGYNSFTDQFGAGTSLQATVISGQ